MVLESRAEGDRMNPMLIGFNERARRERTQTAGGSRTAEDMGAMAGLRHADALNSKIAAGASILYDPWQDALAASKDGVRKFVKLADKIAYGHCFMATFRENFVIKSDA